MSDNRSSAAFQQFIDNSLFQIPNDGVQTEVMPFPISAPLTSSLEESGIPYYGADISGKSTDYGMLSQPEYAPIAVQQQSLYNVAVPCSNGVGTQLPLVMHLPQSQAPLPLIPQSNGLAYYAFDGENKQAEFVPMLQPEFHPLNGQQHAFYNVAIPFAQTVGSQLSFLIHSPQTHIKDHIQTHQLIGGSVPVSKNSRNNLPCVPTVRIAQNPQFANVQHRNLISLTATPPTTSGSLPRGRGRHNATSEDIHSACGSNHMGKVRRVLNSSNLNILNNQKPVKDTDGQKFHNRFPKTPHFPIIQPRREVDVKRQNYEAQSELSLRRNGASTRLSETASMLSMRRFTGVRSYFPEEGSSPLTVMLHCGFCYANSEPEDVFRSHNTHDEVGRTICPRLRQVVCSYCKATGDRAHTAGFCPDKREGSSRSPSLMKSGNGFKPVPSGRLKRNGRHEEWLDKKTSEEIACDQMSEVAPSK